MARDELTHTIEFKPFLALILHTYRSDFINHHIIHKKGDYVWQLFLKFAKPTDESHTKHIIDARIVHFHVDDDKQVFDFIQHWGQA